MRKYQKTQCFETLKLLAEAHAEIIKCIERKQTGQALSLLEQCQQGAIGIGTMIDATEGEGTEAVRCLESYCELLYQIYGSLQQKAPVNPWQQQKKLKKSLSRAENSLRHDIGTQLEAVFLPYKAAMWDSLESVWKAAEEDPDCHALVIPIPYYDKNPDGTLRQMHYEIDLFPEDVPVTPYEAYDFESRHPDMIFIHNPYDDGNYVTSVHPFFYSKNLKGYTEKLVYIPYFILDDIAPDNQAAVEGMEHFCLAEGVINADVTVVQSEAMRQIYVDVLTRHSSRELRPHWEKKILGLGSPKVDRVRSPKEEDFRLPEEWERMVRKEDGARKKIILYNTSVSALLKDGGAALDKMEENFRFFQENSRDVALLWRPHPLTEATLASMRPMLYQRYMEILRAYRESAFGIYDDTADMDRAIAVSDAYYGDWSSIVWLYRQTGKPIMIQNVEPASGGPEAGG